MGILDDAIREHLELKRAHGAPDDEIRRKEAEAFGPVRQDAAPAEPPAPADVPAPADEHTQLLEAADIPVDIEPAAHDHADIAPIAHDHADIAPIGHDHADTDPPLHDPVDLDRLAPATDDPYSVHPGDEPVPDESAPRPAVHHEDEQHPALHDHDHIHGEEHAPEPVFGHGSNLDEPPPRQSAERAEEHDVGDFEPKEEDVLEETPEFLQDAPEHDRLWFEQRPPRDFDFGE